MARTIRNTPESKRDPRHHFPTKRGRRHETRSDRQATRQTLREYAR